MEVCILETVSTACLKRFWNTEQTALLLCFKHFSGSCPHRKQSQCLAAVGVACHILARAFCSDVMPCHLFPRLIKLQPQQPPGKTPSSFPPPDLHTGCSIHLELSFLHSTLPSPHFGERDLTFRSQRKCPISKGPPLTTPSKTVFWPTSGYSLPCVTFSFALFIVLIVLLISLCLSLLNTLNHHTFIRSAACLTDSRAFPGTWNTQRLHVISTQYLGNKWMDGWVDS